MEMLFGWVIFSMKIPTTMVRLQQPTRYRLVTLILISPTASPILLNTRISIFPYTSMALTAVKSLMRLNMKRKDYLGYTATSWLLQPISGHQATPIQLSQGHG